MLLILALHVHLHVFHHVKGPAIDYVGVALAAFLSWFGVPGPGEPVLIAASIVAAKHHLSIAPVVAVAFVGAVVGGFLGWFGGLVAGRPLLTVPGPLRKMRLRAIERGEEIFKRREVIAILLTPAWIAGINRSRAGLYNVVNVVSSLVWAAGIGVAAYYAGPPILDLINDAGAVVTIVFVVLVGGAIGFEIYRRYGPGARLRRRPRHGGEGEPAPTPAERLTD
jgi:membrane protein DedA with SNARE-associated domain